MNHSATGPNKVYVTSRLSSCSLNKQVENYTDRTYRQDRCRTPEVFWIFIYHVLPQFDMFTVKWGKRQGVKFYHSTKAHIKSD